MDKKIRRMKYKFGSSLIEFTLILGIVTLSLIAMQTYVRRGVEGKTKDLADHFIHSDQQGSLESNPDAISFSATNTNYESKSIAKGSLGGSFEIIMPAANNKTTMVAYGNSVDYSSVGGVKGGSGGGGDASGFVPGDRVNTYGPRSGTTSTWSD